MNSLFGGLGNIMMNMGRNTNPVATPKMAAAPQQPNILMQAFGAALRGEDPHTFLQNLAQTNPLLRQYDLTNLQQTAQQVCQQKGVDIDSALNQLDNITNSITQSS